MKKIILVLIVAYSAVSYCSGFDPMEYVRDMRTKIANDEKELLKCAKKSLEVKHVLAAAEADERFDLQAAAQIRINKAVGDALLGGSLVNLYHKKVALNQVSAACIASKGGAACSACLNDFPAGGVAVRCSKDGCKAACCSLDCEKEDYRDHKAVCPICSYERIDE